MSPTFLNFLYQSRGVLAVLPVRESPHEFRAWPTQWVSRRRFDTRVRIVDYIGEDDEWPYVVTLKESTRQVPAHGPAPRTRPEEGPHRRHGEDGEGRGRGSGARTKPYVEAVAFEICDMLFGADTASRMFFHGIKRSRAVGNLALGILRPAWDAPTRSARWRT